MNQQNFSLITAKHKNVLVKFAKRNNYSYSINKKGRKLFNVVIYCSSEAMEDHRF